MGVRFKGCPVCGAPRGELHRSWCDRVGVVKRQQMMYFIEFNLKGIEGHDARGYPIWAKARWPKLFPTRQRAEFHIYKVVGDKLFTNAPALGIRSAAVTGVMVDV